MDQVLTLQHIYIYKGGREGREREKETERGRRRQREGKGERGR